VIEAAYLGRPHPAPLAAAVPRRSLARTPVPQPRSAAAIAKKQAGGGPAGV